MHVHVISISVLTTLAHPIIHPKISLGTTIISQVIKPRENNMEIRSGPPIFLLLFQCLLFFPQLLQAKDNHFSRPPAAPLILTPNDRSDSDPEQVYSLIFNHLIIFACSDDKLKTSPDLNTHIYIGAYFAGGEGSRESVVDNRRQAREIRGGVRNRSRKVQCKGHRREDPVPILFLPVR